MTIDMSAHANKVDFFISYTGADVSWARWVVGVLEGAGYTTITQEYDFRPGQSFIRNMHEALQRAERTLGLFSSAYLESKHCKQEWEAAFKNETLLPLVVGKCEMVGLLGPLAFLDLTSLHAKQAESMLLDAVGAAPSKVRYAFPGLGVRFPGVLPKVSNLESHPRNPNFTGRDDILDALHQQLSSGDPAALTQATIGLGGVGKTQLAIEYANRYSAEYDGIWWLHAENPTVLALEYAALAQPLGLGQLSQPDAITRVRAALGHKERFLLVFDNATTPESLEDYLPRGVLRRVLITSRNHDWPYARAHDIQQMTIGEAVEFLLRRTQQKDRRAATEIAELLGGLPLALEQAAAYVAAKRKTLAEYLRLLAKFGLQLLEKGKVYDYRKTVASTWTVAMDDLKEESPAASDLLTLCAFLAPDAIRLSDFVFASEHLPEPLAAAVQDELKLDEIKESLLRYSLITAAGDDISVHRLVQEVIPRAIAA